MPSVFGESAGLRMVTFVTVTFVQRTGLIVQAGEFTHLMPSISTFDESAMEISRGRGCAFAFCRWRAHHPAPWPSTVPRPVMATLRRPVPPMSGACVVWWRRPHRNALHEVALEVWIDDEDGQGRDDDRRVFDRLADGERIAARHIGRHVLGVARNQDLAEHELERVQIAVTDVDECPEEGVPMCDAIEQDHHRDDRPRQRDDDLEQDRPVVRTVHARGLLERLRNGHEARAHDDEVEGADRPRDDQRPQRVLQAERLPDEEIRRDETAAEEVREHDQEHDRILEEDVPPRERIGTQRGEEDVQRRADDDDEQRVAVAAEDQRVLEHATVGLEGQVDRPEEQPAVGGELARVAERREEDEEQRIQRDDHERDQEEDVADAEKPLRGALVMADPLSLEGNGHHRLVCVNLRLTRFAVYSSTRLMTELKRPTAALNEKSACSTPRRKTYVEITSAVS